MNVSLYRMDASNSQAQWLRLCQFVQEASRTGLIKTDIASLAWLPEVPERVGDSPKIRAGDMLNSVAVLEDIVLQVRSLPLVSASAIIESGDTVQVFVKVREVEITLSKPVRLHPDDGQKAEQPDLQLHSLSFGPSWHKIVAKEVKGKRTFLFCADQGTSLRSHREIPYETRSVSVYGTANVRPGTQLSRRRAD